MATTRGILNAAKAAAAGRPTPTPQGAAPYLGAVSPVAAQLDTMNGYTYGNAYGNFLPRPPDTFTNGAFGPFSPILPVPVDAPEESGRPEPRREQYQVGWDLPTGEPGAEGLKLATFGTLRTLADLYSVARACIQLRKSEIRGLEWDIMPTTDAAKANKGSQKWYAQFGQRRAKALKFFRRPDPDYFSWNTFIDAFLEEILVFDALSLYLLPKRGKGMKKGLFGSDLDCLNLISGPTIRPLYGIHGEFPRPPAPAYQQYLYGVPRSDFTQLITDRDIEEAGLKGGEWTQFRGDQLIYLPMVPRRWTPYGFPPVERALIPIMSGLQKQGYALDFFREGTVPAVYISPGDTSMTPNQIRELQDALNAFAGDPAWHHKIIVLPPGSKVMPQRNAELADQFDEIVMNQVCMAFDVMPMELGIAPKVSTTQSPGAANQMSKMTSSTAQRKATKPMLIFVCDIMNSILQNVCGQDDMRFMFEGIEEEEDEERITSLTVEQIKNGLLSVDEGRDRLHLPPWGLPETSGPIYLSPAGPVPFDLALNPAMNPALNPQQTLPGGGVATTGTPTPGSGGATGGGGAGGAAGATTANTPNPAAAGGTAPNAAGNATVTPGTGGTSGNVGSPSQAAAQGSTTAGGRGNVTAGTAASGVGKPGTGSANTGSTAGAGGGAQTPHGNHGRFAAASATTFKMVVTTGLERAVNAELEALARHLRKGRLISTWVPKNVPPRTLAVISENLSKGLTVDQAVTFARTTTLDGADADPKARRSVELNGQEVETDGDAAGLGGRSPVRHWGDGTQTGGVPTTGDADPGRRASDPANGYQGGFYGDDAAMPTSHDTDVDTRPDMTYPTPPGGGLPGQHGDAQPPGSVVPGDANDRGRAPGPIGKSRRTTAPTAAGVAVQAADTGRVLMLQRAVPDDLKDDPAGGYWEFPGGRLEAGEGAFQAAAREWAEETGIAFPTGKLTGTWDSPNGVYRGFVWAIDAETDLPTLDGRDQVDNPDGDAVEALAWWEPAHLTDNSAVRPELLADLPVVLNALGDRVPGNTDAAVQLAHALDKTGVGAAVMRQLTRNFDPKGLGWVLTTTWRGPEPVPIEDLDLDAVATWAAAHEPVQVDRFVARIKAGKAVRPAVVVQTPRGTGKMKVVDGHHRVLAWRRLGQPATAYVGQVPRDVGPWDETHAFQDRDRPNT